MTLYMGGLQLQLISAYLYYMYTKRNPALLKTLNGKVLLAGLIGSGYLFSKVDFSYQDRNTLAAKIAAHFSVNAFWGATVCNFLINFLP